MWNPPVELHPIERRIIARTSKTRKFFSFIRLNRHRLLGEKFLSRFQQIVSIEGGKAPVDVGVLLLATLLQAYCKLSDRDAVEAACMDWRWKMVLDSLDAEEPPFSQGTLFNFRQRL